jgi:Flp pilus assembly protein TadD
MITDITTDSVGLEEAKVEQRVVIGEESFFGAVNQMIDSTVSNFPTVQRADVVETNEPIDKTSRLLSDIVTSSRRRAERFDTAEAWIDAAVAALIQQDFALAETAFNRALVLRPGDKRARFGLARLAKEEGRTHEALDQLSILYSEDPDDVEVRVGLALAMVSVGRIEDALQTLQHEPVQHRRSATFFGARGSLSLSKGLLRQAIRDLRVAVKLRPDWVYARNVLGIAEARTGNVIAAERRFREAVRVGPTYAEPLVNLVELLRVQRRWAEIPDLVERYWTVDSAPLSLAIAAGSAATEANDLRTGRRWLQAALDKATSDVDRSLILNNLGVVADREGKDDDAFELFTASVLAHGTDVSVSNYGKALLFQGRADEAVRWLTDKLDAGIRGVRTFQALAASLYQLGRFSDAASIAETLLSQNDATAVAKAGVHALLVSIYVDGLNEPQRGVAIAEAGLRLIPADPALLNNLAYALLATGDTANAESALKKLAACDLSGEQKVYLTATQGLLALKKGDVAAGWSLYEEAARISPKDGLRKRVKAKRDLELARALRQTGNLKEIVRLLTRAAGAGSVAMPFSLQAARELKSLRTPDSDVDTHTE